MKVKALSSGMAAKLKIAATLSRHAELIMLDEPLNGIDLIGRDGRYLVFFEVKYRKTARNGIPAEAVGYVKQQRIRYTAQFYLYSRHYQEDMPCRFDVVSILGDQISWIRDAFC